MRLDLTELASLIATTQPSRQDKQQYNTDERRSTSFQRFNSNRDYHGSDRRNSSNRDQNEFHNRHASRSHFQNYSPPRYTNSRTPHWRSKERSYSNNRNNSSLSATPSLKSGTCNECGEMGHWSYECRQHQLQKELEALQISYNTLKNSKQ